MNDEQLLIVLRDCFTGGYTLPQFCIDNNIKKPLFVAEVKFWQFAWEIYVQFRYDKRLTANFSLLDAPTGEINFSVHNILSPLKVKNFSEVNPADFDTLIALTAKKIFSGGKVIYLDALTSYFIRKTYVEIPLLNFLQRNPQVKLFLTNFPSIDRYEGGREFNARLKNIADTMAMLRADTDGHIPTPLDKFGYTNAQVTELIGAPDVIANLDGSTAMQDTDENSLRRIQGGKRATANQPAHYRNKIYFVGSCHHYGVNAPFDKTIESYLQQMLNEHHLPYRVENESQRYFNRYQDIFYNLNKLTPAPGDIVFVWADDLSAKNLSFVDVSDAFDPPNDYREIFCIKGHVNELGYKILAEKYFELLTANNFFHNVEFNYTSPRQPVHRFGIPPQFESDAKPFVNADLKAFKQKLRAHKLQIGALVMNCNPFTLGHLHLVEYAAARVALLYIFVVEEDKSEFPFADRFELVKRGVKNFPNVEVLPSGQFIISQQTFSGYFNKAELQDVAVDSSEDVEIFAKEIAPTLGITIRFAGEEPTDSVTRRYNENMKRILPLHGVAFCEIPRKTFGNEPISASNVRELLKRGDFDTIKHLVPETTFDYLRRHYVPK